MNFTNKPSKRTPSRPKLLAAILITCAGLLAALTIPLWGRAEPRTISYGQFRYQLVHNEVLSAVVGPRMIQGELLPGDGSPRPIPYRVWRVGVENDPQLVELLARYVGDGQFAAEAPPSPLWEFLLPGASLVLMLLVFAWVISRSGGMGSAMAFVKSRARVYGVNDRRVTFEDVAGHDEVVTELKEVVEFLRTPAKFGTLGGRIPKGVLLIGAPGTGKTLLARAVAGEAGVAFFSLSGSDFVELFVGVGASRVRNLFAKAKAKAPCLIFIDELDAIGKARGSGGPGGHDERDQTLNQLLVELDGFDSDRGIILLAATNRPETLDPALVRPGRIDRQVVVDRPDLIGREQILKVHARTVPLDDSISLRRIAAMTPGFVGADLANLVNEAALLAARRGKTLVGAGEFEEGIERIIAGPEKRQRLISEPEKRRIAYHEAGHAIVAHCLPETDPVHKVSIVGRGNGALGYTMYRPEEDRLLNTRTSLNHAISSLLGGTLAEELMLGEASDGCSNDLVRATQIARRMVVEFGMSPIVGRLNYVRELGNPNSPGSEQRWSEQTSREIDLEVRRIVEDAQERARKILESRRDVLDRVANALIKRETLDGSELATLLADSGAQS